MYFLFGGEGLLFYFFTQWPDTLKLMVSVAQIESVTVPSHNLISYTFRPLIKKNNYICLSPMVQSTL